MSNFSRPMSDSDRQSSRVKRNTKGKNKHTIENSTEVIPNFWFPDWRGTPKDEELLAKLLADHIEDGLAKNFYSCSMLTAHVNTAVLDYATPVYMPGGALAYIELRWHVPGLAGYEKKFTPIFRAYREDYTHEITGEREPVLLDTWSNLYKNDAGLLLPVGADELKRACDGATKARSVAWFLCEGRHSMEGVKKRLEDPAVAHIVEAWKREHKISDIVVGAWLGGQVGAAHTNFTFRARNDMQLAGQNDWRMNYDNMGPLDRVVIVPDCDNTGYTEKEIVAEELRKVGCSQHKIFEVGKPPRVPEHWDDNDKLPTDVSSEYRIDQLLNPEQWRPIEYIKDDKNRFTLNPDNIAIKMRHLFDGDGLIYYDEFQGAVMLKNTSAGAAQAYGLSSLTRR